MRDSTLVHWRSNSFWRAKRCWKGTLNPLGAQGSRGDLNYAPCIHIFFYFLAQIERQFSYMEKKHKRLKRTDADQGDSRNHAHPRPNLPSDCQIGTCNNKTFATPVQIKFIENILVGNIWSFFPNHGEYVAITQQQVPHHFVHFLQRPMASIEDHIIMLSPNDPRKTVS